MSIFTKPTELPRWADTGSAPASNIVDPPSGNKDTGWLTNDVPPSSWFNWFMQNVYKWMQWLDAQPLPSMAAVLSPPRQGAAISTFTVGDLGLVASTVVDLTNTSYNRIVAVGSDTTHVYTSDDGGQTWTQRTGNQGTKVLNAVCQKVGDLTGGTNLFVAVGQTGSIITSLDGITWSLRTSGTTEHLKSVVWDGTKFLVGGTNNTLLTSSDGTTWAAKTTGLSATGTNYVAASATLAVVTSDTASTATCLAISSDHGANWTVKTAPATHIGPPSYLAFNTAIFAVTTSNTAITYTSSDGIVWTSRFTATSTISPTSQFLFVLTESGIGVGFSFGATGTSNTDIVYVSLDGITWTTRQYLGYSVWAAAPSHGGLLTMTSDPLGTAASKASLGPCFL